MRTGNYDLVLHLSGAHNRMPPLTSERDSPHTVLPELTRNAIYEKGILHHYKDHADKKAWSTATDITSHTSDLIPDEVIN